MYLVIAEKPSVSRAIAEVIGAQEREDGYLQGTDCMVSWCFGAGEPMRTRHAARTADAAGLVRRFADGCAATGDAGQPSAPGTEGAGGLLRDDEPDVSAGDNRKLAEQPNRGGNCAAERAGGRLLRGAIGKTVDEGYIR